MNKSVRKAMAMDKFNNDLPKVDIGDIVTLADIWDGEGEAPDESYSYQIDDVDWINYCFEVVTDNVDPLLSMVKIVSIDII